MLERAKKNFENDLARASGVKEEFTDHLGRMPVYAMNWADQLFEACAKEQVATTLLNIIAQGEKDGLPEEAVRNMLREKAMKETVTAASQRRKSSSASDTLFHTCMIEAWAQAADRLPYWLV